MNNAGSLELFNYFKVNKFGFFTKVIEITPKYVIINNS